MLRHVLRSQQFDIPFMTRLFERTDELRRCVEDRSLRPNIRTLGNRMMFNIFYEPSTRTRTSFDAAAKFLGMDVVTTENAREFSSAIKGETLEDTVRVLCEYRPDVIVLRHNETGALERAARVSSVPLINAGDGRGQHPTQALLDLYTIVQHFKKVDGLTVLMGGDLANGRTVRSLAYLLSKFKDIQMIFVSPRELRMGDDIKAHLIGWGVTFVETEVLKDFLHRADIVYWTRVQKERLGWFRRLCWNIRPPRYVINGITVADMKQNAILMHPLPRNKEINPMVDRDHRAVYFLQAGNGEFVRMALLEWVLEKW